MSKEISEAYKVDLEILKGILELVIEDEETDAQVLMAIKEPLACNQRLLLTTRPL
jgi:hypothetical protein